MHRKTPLAALLLLTSASAASAQPSPGGGGLTAVLDPAAAWDDRLVDAARPLVADGELGQDDLDRLLAAAGARVNPREGGTLLGLVERQVTGLPAYAVGDAARAHLERLGKLMGLSPASRDGVEAGRTYAGTTPPPAVGQVLARARLHGAVAADITATDADGEGVYSDYPSLTPATENLRFEWTEVTPAALAADRLDTRPRLVLRGVETVTVDGDQVSVVRYEVGHQGTGSISASYDEAFHPVRRFDELVRVRLGYPEWLREWGVTAIREARGTSGDRWASNCAILADGSFHCLPAARRHASAPNLILTNPALARGKQVLWVGHLTARAGVITSVGTSGRFSRRCAEGKDVLVNPIPLLRAWGFELVPGLEARSEHATARYLQDDERCVLRQAPQ